MEGFEPTANRLTTARSAFELHVREKIVGIQNVGTANRQRLLTHTPHSHCVVPWVGIEPTCLCLKGRCLTIWLPGNFCLTVRGSLDLVPV
jgi:hypothetical protein